MQMNGMKRQRALVLHVTGCAGTQRRPRTSERVLVTYDEAQGAPATEQVRASVSQVLWTAKVRTATLRVADVPVDVLMEDGVATTLTFVPRSGTERTILTATWTDKAGLTETPT